MGNKQSVFKSLNCPICEKPFSQLKDGPNAAYMTDCEDQYTMCKSCITSESKLPKEKRVHKCMIPNGDCMNLNCPAYYIYALLSNKALALNKEENGWIFVKEIEIPECPVTHESYSVQRKELEPYVLKCGHTISNEAFSKLRIKRSKDGDSLKHALACPLCKSSSYYTLDSSENPFKGFLKELPAMIEQLELMRKEKMEQDSSSLELFYCLDCKKKMCPHCGFRIHNGHQVVDYTIQEAKKKMKGQIGTSYDVLFPKLSKDINEKVSVFKKEMNEILEKMETMNLVDTRSKNEQCKALCDRFETSSEKYLHDIRAYQTVLHDLLDSLKK